MIRRGTKVLIRRGGHPRSAGVKGSFRSIRGVVETVPSKECADYQVRLLEDDPLACAGWNKKGDVGYWCKSVVRRAKKCVR